MVQIIQTIALLCQAAVGGMSIDIKKVEEAQKSCHIYYMDCVTKDANSEKNLVQCIKERK